jgi:hypothetical protein
MDAKFFEDAVGVSENIHQVRDRRSLVSGHVGNTGLQQGFGHSKNSLAAKFLALTEVQLLHFLFEEAFRHYRRLDAEWPDAIAAE